MARRELSVEVDERLLDALSRASASDGVAPDEVVEEALRRYFGLRGLAVLDIVESQRARSVAPPDDDELLAQAVAEVGAYRAERRSAEAVAAWLNHRQAGEPLDPGISAADTLAEARASGEA